MTGNSGGTPHITAIRASVPQWSPVDVTGNRTPPWPSSAPSPTPQWSPVDVTGNSPDLRAGVRACPRCRNGARST